MKVYVLCGVPGSGKTTLAYQLAKECDGIVHSIDDIPDAFGNPDIGARFSKQWIDNIKADLQNGKSVVCDSLAATSTIRKWIIEEIADFNCEKILCVKVVPIEVCLQRNKERGRKVPDEQIRLTARLLEPPTDDEGWDRIYVYRD